jgi:hypothetical protein
VAARGAAQALARRWIAAGHGCDCDFEIELEAVA